MQRSRFLLWQGDGGGSRTRGRPSPTSMCPGAGEAARAVTWGSCAAGPAARDRLCLKIRCCRTVLANTVNRAEGNAGNTSESGGTNRRFCFVRRKYSMGDDMAAHRYLRATDATPLAITDRDGTVRLSLGRVAADAIEAFWIAGDQAAMVTRRHRTMSPSSAPPWQLPNSTRCSPRCRTRRF